MPSILLLLFLSIILNVLLGMYLYFKTPYKELNRKNIELIKSMRKLEESRSALIHMLRDVTETHKELENACGVISFERDKMKALIANTIVGIVLINSKTEIELINSSAKRMLSIAEQDDGQKNLFEVIEEDEVRNKIELLINEAKGRLIREKRVMELIKMNSKNKYYQISVEKVSEGTNSVKWILMVIRDVTKEKEFDELKEQFVTNISHELRTPLTAIYGSIENMLKGIVGVFSENQKEYLKIAQRNSLRLLKLVNELLDLSKLEAGKVVINKKSVNLRQIIDETLIIFNDYINENEIQVTRNYFNKDIKVFADHEKLGRVFVNLLTNSMKFVKPGGKINIKIDKNENEELLVEVEDDGAGIKEENIDKIFSRFYQADRSAGPGAHGTGLGLPIVKEIIELHGGKVWVESKFGKGTKIIFTLPIKKHNIR